jgi:hypothetical protein
MVQRLEPNEQAQVEDMWVNMLSPTDRLDRDLLLDAVSVFQLHGRGVDRLTMHSDKDYIGGRVRMDVQFDRTHPEADGFQISLFDRGGRLVRAERYTGQEVLDHVAALAGPPGPGRDVNGNPLPDTPDLAARRAAHEAHLNQIMAATQPGQ